VPEDDERVIETEERSAGGPSTHDPAGTRRRAGTSGMLPQDELDLRQERMRTQRRSGGPKLTEADEPEAEAPDVPPTETEEPPAESP
jgi:hypothetical protein